MKPISDKWIAEVIEYGYSRRSKEHDCATIRRLARQLRDTRLAIRRWRDEYGEFSQFDMLDATLPEGGR